jgi:thioesterase domain-containing protein
VRNLVWLASYPKSGNTWMRAFLTAYLAEPGADLDVNDLDASLHAASRELFDRVIGYPASDLTAQEIDDLRPAVYRVFNAEATGPLFIKTHDAWRRNRHGEAVFPADASRVAIVIVRNPLAIAPSLASHSNLTIDAAIDRMGDAAATLATQGASLDSQLPQPMGTWSEQVASWLEQDGIPTHLVHYEHLRTEPHEQFSRVLAACGIEPDETAVADALEATRFERLQAAERAGGFRERPLGSAGFFRTGRVDGWREELTAEQVARIVSDHHDVMHRLGYDTSIP